MEYPLISVVIPVYNCSKYIEKCVLSVIGQKYPTIEIILVNDGSKDDSGIICDNLSKNYSNVRVVHQENRGQAASRNSGVEMAQGQYIAFIDADDWIDENMYLILYNNLKKENAHISCCGIEKMLNGTHLSYFNKNVTDYYVFNTIESVAAVLDNRIITCSPCDKLFVSKIIKETPMQAGIIFEDFEIMPRWLSKATKVVYTGKPLYFYRYNNEGTMSNITKKRLDEVTASNMRVEFYSKQFPSLLEKVKVRHIEISLNVLSFTRFAGKCNEERNNLARSIVQEANRSYFTKLHIVSKVKYVLLLLGFPIFDFIVLCKVKLFR